MTAINFLIKDDAAFVIGETLIVRSLNSRVVGFFDKLIRLPKINAVIAMRGSLFNFARARTISSRLNPSSFEELKTSLVRSLKSDRLFRCFDLISGGTDVGVIGWCERNGPSAFFFSSSKIHDRPPWTLMDIPYKLFMPATEADVGPFYDDCSFDDVARDGRRLLQAERMIVDPRHPSRCLVGGQATLTTIRFRKITDELIGAWPDEIGKLPDRNAELSPYAPGAIVGKLGR